MTNAELIQKIRAEIERRIKECEATYPKDKDGYWFPEQEEAYAIAEEYKHLLSFLSTLEESEIPKNLEQASKEYCPDDAYPFGPDIINKEVRKAFIAGYHLCKEQMLKEAVEGTIVDAGFDEHTALVSIPDKRYDEGDKVRIIVCKNEDEK